jgi:CzcA family heavy metal efflux pump
LIDGIIRWSLGNRVLVLAGAVALMAWGVVEAIRMPIDVFPDLTAPSVTVVADAHGMAPEEVETLLTLPIERALNGANGVRRVRSRTQVGIVVVSVDFDWGTDIFQARQVVSERLQQVAATLPQGTDPPMMGPITSIMGDILYIGLTSERHSPMELRTLGEWTIARRLLAVPGVAQVITMGGDVRQYQVLLNPKRLDALEITADEVAHALEKSNQNTSAGFLIDGGQESLIHGVGRVSGPEDIGNTLVTMRGELPVRVSDVGSIGVGPALKRGEAGVDGERGVVIGIRKQPGANTIELTLRIQRILESLKPSLPEGIVLHDSVFRQADFIEVAIENVGTALRDGALLVVLTVLLFVMSGSATVITALAIPLSLLTAVVAMRWQGIEINTMTLGGMAIAVGVLVDDAIIDVENVARRLRLNAGMPEGDRRSVLAVVFDASKEIRQSIVFATLVIIVVFAPLLFLTGVEGRLLRPLGFAYAVSLAASLLVALTVTPVLCSLLLPRSRMMKGGQDSWVVRNLKRLYAPVLAATVQRWRSVTSVALVGLAAAAMGLFFTGGAFLPPFNEGALTVSVTTLPGTSLEESERLGIMAEQILLSHPEVVTTARRTGRAERDEHTQPVSSSEIEARLSPLDTEERSAFLARLRTSLGDLPGTNVIIGQPLEHRIDHMLSGTRANIAVKIFGPELRELRDLAERTEAIMRDVDGVADLSIERQAEVPFVTVRFKRAAIARYGLTVEGVAHEIETAFQGRTVSRVLEDQAEVDLVVRYDASAVDTLHAVQETHIGTPTGARLPLHVVADVHRDVGPNVISRENVERKIVVSCNVAGRDLQSVVADIRQELDAHLSLPPRYRVEYGGQFQSAQEASQVLFAVGAIVLIVVFLLLCVALGTVRDGVLVMVNLPLALIGGVIGVHLAGGVVSVASLIGFITLFGIATRNGIMMITHFHHLVRVEGVTDLVEAVTRGARERLSPILMTAISAGLGLLPLVLADGKPGSEIETPMAIVILWGLGSATFLNLMVMPALYLRFGALRADFVSRGEAVGSPGGSADFS